MSTATLVDHDIQVHLRKIRLDGFTIFDDVVSSKECDRISDQLIKVAEQQRIAKHNKNRIAFVPGVINYDQSFSPYLADSRVLGLAEILLGPNVRLSFTSAIINEPGKRRTTWHADWPFNQNNACHVPTPYPDCIMHLTALLMISPFTEANGGTLVVPGSHRFPSNPTDSKLGIDPTQPYATEFRVTGPAGSMVVFDSRLWHCPPANPSDHVRIALGVRYAPWWLNLEPLNPDSDIRKQLVEEPGLEENEVPKLSVQAYESLPEQVRPLLRHWVAR